MILKSELATILRSERDALEKFSPGVIRQELVRVTPRENFAIIISGIRRCGKSTLLLQSMKREEEFFYLNFEDPRLAEFELKDIALLEEVFYEEFGEKDLYYFDEIQNLPGWESYVRYLLDRKKKVIITGSNASLLSRDLGTKLTGRNLRIELFPFSYDEYLNYMECKDSADSFRDYLSSGGFPEYLRTGLDEVLQNLLMDIIARDIIYRNPVKNPGMVTELAIHLLGNISREFTLSKLHKKFSAIGSKTTIASYLNLLEDAYIIFTLPRFSYSQKSRQINPRKAYAIDNGLIHANSVLFSEDRGRFLENHVFLELRKRYRELFYFREKGECDFIVKEQTKITKAIQVCYEVNSRNKDREIGGLLEAMDFFGLDAGYILTYDQEETMIVSGKQISLIPARNFEY
ncbi:MULTISPECIES: ATP-binding protein [Methanocalculus]|uniref:ATP-binding protein n=1 Tax=Methanocalculus TaxID=71151 RepID=UPI0020A0DD3B|nr:MULTISPECIES: ATP-binding protein [unclassified Methanocalculus]MCP1663149.1 putative AAA+ superfamily ATPase [Methanocalculus sp. AMF5]